MSSYRRIRSYEKLILSKAVLISFFFALCIIPSPSTFAAAVNLAWDASTGPNINGYKVHYGTSSRNYAYNVNVGNSTSCSLSGLQEGTRYYFAATAYNTSNVESNYSSEISYTVPTSSSSGTSSTGTTSGTSSTGTTTSGTGSAAGTSGSATAIILDNGGSGTRSSGTWENSNGPNSYGTQSVFSKSVSATYTFETARSGSQQVYLWWTTTGTTRYSAVPVKIYNGSTLIGTATVNQQQKGGVWNLLGNYSFSGQARVVVESRSSAYSTCADAVKFAPVGASSVLSSTGLTATSGSSDCTLDTKFEVATMRVGAYYYTDRDYTITGGVPDFIDGRDFIRTVNDERSDTSTSGYVRFTNPDAGWVYVLFDSRSLSMPNWLNGWELRTERITTSLDVQAYLKVYRKQFGAGQCVDLGGNYGPGSSIETRSNYVVVY